MKDKLFKMLFPNKYADLAYFAGESDLMQNVIDAKESLIEKLEKQIEVLENQPEPDMADLMRDIIDLPMVDFANVDSEGYPLHYLEGITDAQRKEKLEKLSNFHQSGTLQEVFDFWINQFGNHSVRKSSNENVYAGRFSINGVAMIRKDLARAHAEYNELLHPDVDFDEFEVGVPLPDTV